MKQFENVQLLGPMDIGELNAFSLLKMTFWWSLCDWIWYDGHAQYALEFVGNEGSWMSSHIINIKLIY